MKHLCPFCKLPTKRGYNAHFNCVLPLRRRIRTLEAAMRKAAHELVDEKPEITAPLRNRLQAAYATLSLTGALDTDPSL